MSATAEKDNVQLADGRQGTKVKRQRRKIPPVPFLIDHTLTILYVVLTVWTFYIMSKKTTSMALFCFFLVMTAIAVRVSRYVFGVGGRWFSENYLKGPPFNNPMAKPLVARKFVDQSWQLVCHFSMAIVEIAVVQSEPWWEKPITCWIPEVDEQVAPPMVELLYICQLAIWIYTAFSHRFFEERRKDYVVMFVHHLCTILLVATSYNQNYIRIGVLVLLVHDVSDIPLDVGKMVNYLKLQDRKGWYMSEIWYTLTMIFWIYFRLWQFPFRVIYSALIESHIVMSPITPGNIITGFFPGPRMPLWKTANAALMLLLCLHIWWFFLLCKIGYGVLFVGVKESTREQYEGDSDSTDYDIVDSGAPPAVAGSTGKKAQ